jgi:hypothetical protein
MEYRVEGTLPDLPASAPGYRLGSATTAAAVQKLAVSLGLTGDVKEEANAWVVRAGDRELRVERFAGLPWSLGQACGESPVPSQGGESVVTCAGTAVATEGGGGSASVGSAVAGDCPPDAECVVPDPATAPVPDPIPVATTAPAAAPPVQIAPAAPLCDPGTACLGAPVAPCKGADQSCGGGVAPACAAGATCAPPAPPAPNCAPGAICAQPASPAPAPAPGLPPGAEPAPPPPTDLPVPEPPVKPLRPADLPSRQEADRIARTGFARLGVGTEGFALDDGFLTWEARVEARVDGLPVLGLGTSLSIGSKGEVVRANGYLAVPDRIGDYPLVGVDAGLKRLTTGFGAGPGPRPLVAIDQPAPVGGVAQSAPAPCSSDPAIACQTTPLTTVPGFLPPPTVITGVHLALLQLGDALVPAYAFELAGGAGPVPVPAVPDEWLDK